MKVKKLNLYMMLFSAPIVVASFRFLDVGPDYPAYKYIYENGIVAEPIFYALNLAFQRSGVPFEAFHLFLSSLAFYWFLNFLIKQNLGFFTIFFSGIFFYVFQIASHWRTGLALATICFFVNRGTYEKLVVAIAPALLHISALVAIVTRYIGKFTLLLIFLFFFLNFFILDIVVLLGEGFFALLGREKFFHAILAVANGEENYLHRSLWKWDNPRAYFVVLTTALMWAEWKKKSSPIINVVMLGNFAFLLFLFNAYIAQKSYLLFKPLQLAAAMQIGSKDRKLLCVGLVVFFSILDVVERYAERL